MNGESKPEKLAGPPRSRRPMRVLPCSVTWARRCRLSLPWNLGLDKLRKQCQRLLPAEITSLDRNRGGYAFLHDIQLGSAGHLLQGNGRPHLSGQIRVIKLVCMANAFVGHEFEVLAAKGVTMPCAEVR